MDLERVRDEWDRESDVFDLEPDHGLSDPTVRAAWWRTLEPLLPPAPATCADLGCGTGTISVLLGEHGYDVTGVDISPRMIELARAKARAAEVAASFEVGDAAQPGLPDGAFDAVVARHVVWALADPAAALRCWVALLAPGGRLVLVEGRWGTGAGLTAEQVTDLVAPLVREFRVQRLDDAGLWGREIDDERYVVVAEP